MSEQMFFLMVALKAIPQALVAVVVVTPQALVAVVVVGASQYSQAR